MSISVVKLSDEEGSWLHLELDLKIHEGKLDEENLVFVVHQLVDHNAAILRVHNLTGGVTNILFRVELDHASIKSVIVRVNGRNTDIIIDRDVGTIIQAILDGKGLGPKLFGTFKGGCIYGYVEGRVLDISELREEKVMGAICSELAQWHSVSIHHPNIERSPVFLKQFQKWLDNLDILVKEKEDKFRGVDIVSFKKEANSFLLFIKNKYNVSNVVFCHNDLIPRNLIYQEDSNHVAFIDYEYSGYNYRGFDLANHFCEYAGLDLNYGLFPDKETQYKFLYRYLFEFLKREPTQKEMDELFEETSDFVLGSHILWSTWGFIQYCHSTIDFDYLKYSETRFKVFLEWKEKKP